MQVRSRRALYTVRLPTLSRHPPSLTAHSPEISALAGESEITEARRVARRTVGGRLESRTRRLANPPATELIVLFETQGVARG
ncbi:hypothetical protein FRAHR75_580008 [Frankia sp. Hr75.2]|nr:hypothetical protein FRAHR75_580008 [Frankia sp. Hr75.2]